MAAIPFVLAFVIGCTATSTAVKLPAPVMTGKPVSMDCILVNTCRSAISSAAEEQEFNDAIVSHLKSTELFEKVSEAKADTNSGGGIRVVVEIKEIKRVSEQARDWTGVLAGSARILVSVTVSDLASGNPIEGFAVEGRSKQSAYGGTTEEAVQSAAAQIKAVVVHLNEQSSE